MRVHLQLLTGFLANCGEKLAIDLKASGHFAEKIYRVGARLISDWDKSGNHAGKKPGI